MHIDVVSDFVCPWCFIGARRLAAACASLQAGTAAERPRVLWHAFFLNPQTPPEGEPYAAFMERKFGSRKAVEELHHRISEAARGDGIEFAFEHMTVRPSTFAAHDLVARVQEQGLDAFALSMKIFEAHFLRGLNIGVPDVLAGLLEDCGLDGVSSAATRRSSQRERALTAFADRTGSGGVPLFVFDRRQALAGAQPVELLHRAMRDSMRGQGD